jgi:hypothetical protein
MKKTTGRLILAINTILLLSTIAYAKGKTDHMPSAAVASDATTSAPEIGPHGGTIIRDQDGTSEFEVYFHDGEVDVFNLHPNATKPDLAPKEMSVTLFMSPQDGQTIELKATAPGGVNEPHFHGKTAVKEGSFVGFELRFRTPGKEKLRVLRHMPIILPAR